MSAVGSATHIQELSSGGPGDGVVTLTWSTGSCAFGSLPPGSTGGTGAPLAPATPVAAAITFTG
jgi:hypothetical protein